MFRIKKLVQTLLIALVMTACGTNPPSTPSPDMAKAPTSDSGTKPAADTQETSARDAYIIQPGDILTISVWKERDLQGELAVRPDGALNFPLVGEIVAAGRTVEQLKTEIATRLSKYVPDPVVTVIVKNSLGNKIFVIGKVNRPGEFVTNRNMDVMQALSMAGGPNPYASVNKIKILRRVNGELQSIPFKYSRVEKGEALEQNIVLQGGDVVVVP